jgi:hypothetical protein
LPDKARAVDASVRAVDVGVTGRIVSVRAVDVGATGRIVRDRA